MFHFKGKKGHRINSIFKKAKYICTWESKKNNYSRILEKAGSK